MERVEFLINDSEVVADIKGEIAIVKLNLEVEVPQNMLEDFVEEIGQVVENYRY